MQTRLSTLEDMPIDVASMIAGGHVTEKGISDIHLSGRDLLNLTKATKALYRIFSPALQQRIKLMTPKILALIEDDRELEAIEMLENFPALLFSGEMSERNQPVADYFTKKLFLYSDGSRFHQLGVHEIFNRTFKINPAYFMKQRNDVKEYYKPNTSLFGVTTPAPEEQRKLTLKNCTLFEAAIAIDELPSEKLKRLTTITNAIPSGKAGDDIRKMLTDESNQLKINGIKCESTTTSKVFMRSYNEIKDYQLNKSGHTSSIINHIRWALLLICFISIVFLASYLFLLVNADADTGAALSMLSCAGLAGCVSITGFAVLAIKRFSNFIDANELQKKIESNMKLSMNFDPELGIGNKNCKDKLIINADDDNELQPLQGKTPISFYGSTTSNVTASTNYRSRSSSFGMFSQNESRERLMEEGFSQAEDDVNQSAMLLAPQL